MLIFIALARAEPPPFDQIDQVDSFDGCIIRMGRPLPDSRVQPLRAECHWSDVTLARMAELLGNYERYGDFIACMREVRVVRDGDPRGTLVWQLDNIGIGLSERESETWMSRTDAPGALQVAWRTANEPFTPRSGSVVMPFNEGAWWVTASPGGGVDIVEDLRIDPGGSLPSWVVNWFQTYGISAELKQLHDLAISPA